MLSLPGELETPLSMPLRVVEGSTTSVELAACSILRYAVEPCRGFFPSSP